jgi:hypothetical protein
MKGLSHILSQLRISSPKGGDPVIATGEFITRHLLASWQIHLQISTIYGDGSKPWYPWMFIPLKKLSIGIDPYPYSYYCTMVNKPTSKTGGHLLGRLVGQNRD